MANEFDGKRVLTTGAKGELDHAARAAWTCLVAPFAENARRVPRYPCDLALLREIAANGEARRSLSFGDEEDSEEREDEQEEPRET